MLKNIKKPEFSPSVNTANNKTPERKLIFSGGQVAPPEKKRRDGGSLLILSGNKKMYDYFSLLCIVK